MHLQEVYVKACMRLIILRMLKYKVYQKPLSKIYLIKPVLEYWDIILNNCSDQSYKLENVLTEAERIITGMSCISSR